MKPQQFRKKPVVIEAVQFDGTLQSIACLPITEVSQEFTSDTCQIKTLEGVMTADKGDWIIKGVKGEFYPCKPAIFVSWGAEVGFRHDRFRKVSDVQAENRAAKEHIGRIVRKERA